MLVFVDESGDAGMKLDSGSSKHFVVTATGFKDRDEAGACDQAIAGFRRSLGYHDRSEFRFNSCAREVRQGFLKHVLPYEFFYFSIVLNKARLTGPGFQYPASLYKYAVGLVFENAKPHLKDATVIIDQSGGREFRNQLKRYLSRRINDDADGLYIKKVKTEASHSNNLLQLADMICGAVARSYSEKADRMTYRRIVKPREVRVQVWP